MKNITIYDYAVIGGGLAGLCVAKALSKHSENVVLIDANEELGGLNRNNQNGLRYLPNNELSQKALNFLSTLVESKIVTEVIESSPVTFEDGQIKPFVGFGDNSPAFYEEIAYFLSNSRIDCELNWVKILTENLNVQILNRSHVTKFHSQDNKINRATINNGQKEIYAHNFIYCGPVKDLDYLLPQDSLAPKARQKLSKSVFATAVCLDLTHELEITESKSIHVLDSVTADEFGPCIGLFSKQNEKYVSQWVSFIQDEDIENAENTGAALKKMKRQIKRAYPDIFEKTTFERVLIAPTFSGNGDLKVSANQTLPNHENFWIGSGSLNQQKNLLGALLQAELVISALGVHPQGYQVKTEETGTDLV